MPPVEYVGWEYDLLRTLPPAVADDVWIRAWVRMHRTWRGYVLVGWPSARFAVVLFAAWEFVGWLGWGWFGKLAADAVVFHWLLGHPSHWFHARVELPLVRPYLLEELLLFAEREFSPDRPPGER